MKIATRGSLHGSEPFILCGAVTLVMWSLTIIGTTGERARLDPRRRTRLIRHLLAAAVPLSIAPVGAALPLVVLVGILVAVCAYQVWLAQFWQSDLDGRAWYAANASEPSLPM